MKAIRWIGYGVALLFGLALLAILSLTLLVTPEDHKPQIEQAAADNGVTLKIGGKLHWSVFPLGFSAGEITLQLPQEDGDKPQHVLIEKLSLSLGILPLMRGNLQIGAFDIDNIRFFTADTQTLQFREARLKVDDANNRGESFPVQLRIDDTNISGSLAISTVNNNLLLQVDLQGDQIDLDRYTPVEPAADDGAGPSGQPDARQPKKSGKPKQTEEPLPFASLLQAQGSYRIRFERMVTSHLQLGNVLFDAKVEPEKVILNAFNAELYQGKLSNHGTIELPPGEPPLLKLEIRIDKVQLSPLLADATQETPDITAGVLDLAANIQGRGDTQRKIMRTLTGNASIDVNELVIRDMNLEKLACDAAAAAQKRDPVNKQWPRDTLLHNLHADSTIINGIAFIKPVTARLDTVSMIGNGPVNLLSEMLDLKLDITVLDGVNSANSCEAINPAVRDVAWPVRCEGSYRGELDDLCGVDKSRLGKLIAQLAAKNLQEGGGSLKDTLRNLFH